MLDAVNLQLLLCQDFLDLCELDYWKYDSLCLLGEFNELLINFRLCSGPTSLLTIILDNALLIEQLPVAFDVANAFEIDA